MPTSFFLAAWLMVAGCAGPTVTVRHVLPGDLPVTLEGRPIVVKAEVVGGPQDTHVQTMTKLLTERLARVEGEGGELTVSASIYIDSKDAKEQRDIRHRDKTGRLQPHEVASFVRTVDLRVDYVVTDASGEPLAAAETNGHYTSLADPQSRRPLGLERADDPANERAVAEVVPELLKVSVESFVRMATPPLVTAAVQMRPAAGILAAQGEAAVRDGRYADAADFLRRAADERARDYDVRFNLAVAEELAGRLAEAMADYRLAQQLRPKAGPAAGEAIARLQRVMPRLEAARQRR